MKLNYLSIPVLLALSLTGCSGKYTEPKHYSGFLPDYDQSQQQKSISGTPVLRWVSPNFKATDYDSVYIAPVVFWPNIPLSEQAEKEKLQSILDYTNRELRKALKEKVPVADKPGPRTLMLKTVITAVDIQQQGLNVWEVMPVPALIAGTQYLTGYRTLDVTFYFEAEVSNSLTNEPLITAIRRSQSATLSNSHKLLTISDAKKSIDNLISDFSLYDESAKK